MEVYCDGLGWIDGSFKMLVWIVIECDLWELG